MSPAEPPTRDEFYESLLGDFLDESAQLLDRLNEHLLRLDEWIQSHEKEPPSSCDEELLHEMFRAAHSLKGLSAMLGLQDINQLTHKVENVFDAARKDQLPITREVVNLIFEAVDRLGALVGATKEPERGPVEYEEVLEKIHQVLLTSGAERGPSTQVDVERTLTAIEQGLASLDTPPSDSSDATNPPIPPQTAQASSTAPPSTSTGQEALKGEILSPAGCQSQEDSSFAGTSQEVGQTAEGPDPLEGIEDESALPTKYVRIFIDEAEQVLDQLTEILLNTEGVGKRESVTNLLSLWHKLKGSSATIGLHRAAKMAHLMEDVVQGILANQGGLTPALTDVMLQGTDALRQFVQTLREGHPTTEHFGPVVRELLAAQRDIFSHLSTSLSAHTPSPSSSAPQPSLSSRSALSGGASKSGTLSIPGESPGATQAGQTHGESHLSQSFAPVGTSSGSASWRTQVIAKVPEGARAILGEVSFEPRLPLVGLKGRLIYEKLCHLGEVCQFDPPLETLDEMEHLEKVSFGVLTEQPIDEVESHLHIAGVRQIVLETWPPAPASSTDSSVPTKSERVVERGLGSSTAEAASVSAVAAKSPAAQTSLRTPTETPAPDSSVKPTETLRVDIERLDQLMNLAGQLVINKARFTQIGDTLKHVLSGKNPLQLLERVSTVLEQIGQERSSHTLDAQVELETFRAAARRVQHDMEELRKEIQSIPRARQAVYELQETVHQLDRVTDGLQRCVMQTRMVPIGPLFTRFKRVVRDITRLNGKSARLIILGEKTELDKRMIDELGDPLIHLVRNAVDHGIEAPEVREALGKPRQGTITLEAFHRGNSIVIRVSDDGRGLDAEKILHKAIEKGLVSPADAEKMTRQQIYQLIWQPGFSTAEKVTEVSGRGMGMDIVLSKIADLNGMAEIDSTPGVGTTMTLKLPLTLAILPSLMIEIDKEAFALPIEAVVEIVHLRRSDMYTIQGHWTARVRNAVIAVVYLSDLFTWNHPSNCCAKESEEITLVILGDTGHQIGLAVDHVLGEEDVVIKSISENYHNVPGIAGASILGDGRVALILDVAALVEMASGRSSVSAC